MAQWWVDGRTCSGIRARSVPMPAKAAAAPSSRLIMRVTQANSRGPHHKKVQYGIDSSNRLTSLLTRFTTWVHTERLNNKRHF